jgi:hypothetical protein
MTPEKRLLQESRELISQKNCSTEDAVNGAVQLLVDIAFEADMLLRVKQQLELERELERVIT